MEHAKPEDAILARARADCDRWSAGDTEGYGQSAAEDITYFHNVPALPRMDGVQAFREFLSALQGQVPPHRYEFVKPMVQVYGEVGILTMEYHAFSPEGELLVRARCTCVYRESDGDWQMVHAHFSVPDDA